MNQFLYMIASHNPRPSPHVGCKLVLLIQRVNINYNKIIHSTFAKDIVAYQTQQAVQTLLLSVSLPAPIQHS